MVTLRSGQAQRMPRRHASVALAASAIAVALALVAPPIAAAFVPVVESTAVSDVTGNKDAPYPRAQAIPPPDGSEAVYGRIAPDTRFDSYAFTVSAPVTTTVGLVVPAQGQLSEFRPDVTVVSESGRTRVSVEGSTSPTWPTVFDPFAIAYFSRGPTRKIHLAPGTRYWAVVSPGAGKVQSGPYVLIFGRPESFTPRQWVAAVGALPSIWSGNWAGGPVRPEFWVAGVIAVLTLLLILGLLGRGIRWLRRKYWRR